MSFRKFLTQKELEAALEEAIDELEAEGHDDVIDAVYLPPDVDTLTDEENIDDENYSPENEPTDIAGTFELQVPDNFHNGYVRQNEQDEWSSSDEEDLASKRKRLAPGPSRKVISKPKWVIGEIDYTHSAISKESADKERIQNELAGKTPLEIFDLFLDDEVLQLVTDFSLKYAQDNNRQYFRLSKNDLLNFIGILLFSGYHSLPQIPMYWSTDEDKGVDIIKKCMSRNRFQSIKQNLHLSDNNNLDINDKFAKVRPFLDAINRKNLQWGVFAYNLSIDEQMVPYYGKHSCKMFIKGKPVRFGFKLWCICSADGYLFYSLPYAGASEKHSKLGLGGDVVMSLLSVIDSPMSHQIFFDNFFSSYQLFEQLKNDGYFATGTIRENRTQHCPLEKSKQFSKRERGSYVSAFEENTKISLVRWNDNATVTVCSNVFNVQPIHHVKRYNRKERKEINVTQPHAITEYNRSMGGVDLHDNGIANYRCRVLGKKWWWPIFRNAIDSIVVNAWKLYNVANRTKMSQIEFKSYVALRLLKNERVYVERNVPRPVAEIRFDNIGHVLIAHETKARRRCRVCHNHSIFICQKCNEHLHVSCFAKYHQR